MSARPSHPKLLLLHLLAVVFSLTAAPGTADAAEPTLRYRMTISKPTTQYVEVEVTVNNPRSRATTFVMPAWAPGSYLVRDFGRHVYEAQGLSARGKALPTQRLDKQRWRVEHKGESFRFRYRVYANELSVRTSYLDDRFALLNGSSIFVYLEGQKSLPARLELRLPRGWQSYGALDRVGQHYQAVDYDELADSPWLLGKHERRQFDVDGTRFEYIFAAPGGSNASLDRLVNDTEKIVRATGSIMGGFPFRRYVFLVIADEAGGGGLEHLDSTAMITRPWSFDDEEGYRSMAGLTAHEFFHAWNGKRLRDKVLGPFDYTKENYTDLLWFHEGFTNTMQNRILLHAGITEGKDYLQRVEDRFNALLRRPGRNYTPMNQLSKDAWIKGYKPSPNHRNTVVSYYSKGELIGAALDIELRARAAQQGRRASIESMFRRLWEDAKDKNNFHIGSKEVIAAASAEAGDDMQGFFDRFVFGRSELELPAALRKLGVKTKRHLRWREDDGSANLSSRRKRVFTGINGYGTTVSSVDRDSPAERAGIMAGDEIVAVNRARVHSVAQLRERIADLGPGDRVELTLFRRNRLTRLALVLKETPQRRWRFTLPAESSRSTTLTTWLMAG